VTSPFDQSRYQVRFERGIDGLRRLASSDVVIVVDALRFSTTVTDAVARGDRVPLDDAARATSRNGAVLAEAAAGLPDSPVVLLGCFRNASAVAREVLAEQHRRGERTSIAVIAAGELTGAESDAALAAPESNAALAAPESNAALAAPESDAALAGVESDAALARPESDAAFRVAVEDDLAAGAVIDALAVLGVDYSSPEAAAVCEAFRGLRGAVRHLLTASGSGQELQARGLADEVRAAGEIDAVDAVPVLRDGAFVAASDV
jgi:2-phosphosulfolactate phosphatase